ncbi:hypothetical protein GCM10008969_26230 [Pseudomonas veronii subsp. inensis]
MQSGKYALERKTDLKSTQTKVGGGLLPIVECQYRMDWLTHHYREQAPSHMFSTALKPGSGP